MGDDVRRRPAFRAAPRPQRASGIAAPTSSRRSPIAANAIRRATFSRRSTTAANSRAPSRAAGSPITSRAIRRAVSATGPNEELAHYLATGHAEGRGTAAGPMGEAVDLSLVHLTGDDIAAIAAYLRTVPPIANPALPAPRLPNAIAAHEPGASDNPLGEQIYAEACASCHGWTGKSPISAWRRSLAPARSTIRPASTSRSHPVRGRAEARRSGHGDARLRRRLFRRRDRRRSQLRHRAFGDQGSRLTAENVAGIRLTR